MPFEHAVTRPFATRVVPTAFHCVGELIAPHEGGDEKRDDQRSQSGDPSGEFAMGEGDATAFLRLHDAGRVFENRRDEAKGDRDGHRDFVGREMNDF